MSTRFQTLQKLRSLYGAMEARHPDLLPALDAALEREIAPIAAAGPPDDAWRAFCELPVQWHEASLLAAGRRPAADALLAAVTPFLGRVKRAPNMIQPLSNAALTALVARGLDLDSLLSAEDAAEIWLTRGRAFGETPFRRTFKKKDPVIVFWEAKSGLIEPKRPLCADGVALMAKTLSSLCERQVTRRLAEILRPNCVSDRLFLAVAIHNPVPLDYMCRPGAMRSRKSPLGVEVPPALVALTAPPDSAHAQRANARKLARMPSLEEILSGDLTDLADRVADILGVARPSTAVGADAS